MARQLAPKPQAEKPAAQEQAVKEEVSAPKPSGIQVVALRKGFYNQDRKSAGDKFLIPSLKEWGTWMKCVDPKAQEQAEKLLKEKRAGK